MQAVGIDSCVFQRSYEGSSFEALLGVAVTTIDKERFRKHYDAVLNNAFSMIGHVQKKHVYKAAHITHQLQDATADFLKYFLQQITTEIIRVNIFFTYYPEDKIDRIYTCQDSFIRSYTPEKFLNQINNAYPHYCVWRYLAAHPDCKNYIFEVDHFQGKITPAWREIEKIQNLNIFHSGGECNKLISTSDIILRYLCNNLGRELERQNILYCLKDILNETRIHSYYMGYRSDYLKAMAFTDKLMINTRPYIKHPIYWVLWKSISGDKEEKSLFEWSDTYNEIMQSAESSGGCVRFYKASEVPHLLDEANDIVCIANDEARPYLSAIQSIAPEIKIVDYRGKR